MKTDKESDTYKTLEQVKTILTGLKNSYMNDFRNYSEPQICVYLDNAIAELNMAEMCCVKE